MKNKIWIIVVIFLVYAQIGLADYYSPGTVFSPTHSNVSYETLDNFKVLSLDLGNNCVLVEGYNMSGIYCENSSTTLEYTLSKLYLQATNYLGNQIINFSLYLNGTYDGHTTNGAYNATIYKKGTHNVTIIPADFESDSVDIIINKSFTTYNFTDLNNANTLNITFYDSDTHAKLTGIDITTQFIGPTPFTYYTNNASLYMQNLIAGDYTLLFDASNYQQGKYILHFTNNSYQDLALYMQKSQNSSLVLISVQDRFGSPLQGVEVIVQKWNNDSWVTDQIVESDFRGQTEAYYLLSNTFYNHVLRYQSATVYGRINGDENKKIIYTEDVANGIRFTFDTLGDDVLAEWEETYDIITNITFVNTSETYGYFRFFWSDPDNTNRKGCLDVYKGGSMELYETSCTTTSTGTLFVYVNQTDGKALYTAKAALDDYYVKDYVVRFGEIASDMINWGVAGYVFGFFMVLVAIFMFVSVPTLSILAGSVVFVLLAGLGVIFRDVNFAVFIVILAIGYLVATIKSESGVNA